jgi:neurofibromin 1
MDDNDSEMLVAIVTSLTKMMEKLPPASRYGMQLFWLALSLVRLVPLPLFNCTALFLDAIVNNLAASGDFKGGRMVPALLQGRLPLEDAASQLDELYGIHFNIENFHFALCASMVKGLTDAATKGTAIRVLSTFLDVTSRGIPPDQRFPKDVSCLPYLGLLMSRAMTPEEARENLWLAGWTNEGSRMTSDDSLNFLDLQIIKDKELLLNVAISIIDFRYLEETVQNRSLLWMNRIATKRPKVILHLYVSGFLSVDHLLTFHSCEPVIRILDDILISCQNAVTLESAHALLRTLTSNSKFADGVDTAEMLEDVLEGIGFGGLWRSSTFHTPNEHERESTALTDRLIEVSLQCPCVPFNYIY